MNHQLFANKTLLITGGTGSFGKHFTKYMLDYTDIKKVIIYSRDEFKQFTMQDQFKKYEPRIRFFIGDVRDSERLKTAFQNVNYVIHAAAMKHVPICEYNPFEAIKSNIQGTQNVADAAIHQGVEKLIGISTDKAVNPVNLYGATKLAADKLLVAANSYVGAKQTAISVVRFGNFAGSRGSVIPIFQDLISQGIYELPITDMNMTRYWISLTEACESIIQTLIESQGGEIFVPKMPSFKITDLGQAIHQNCTFKHIGLREGERLHEVLISEYDSLYTYEHQGHYIIYPKASPHLDSAKKNHGTLVTPYSQYSSDNNQHWLSIEDIQKRIQTDLSLFDQI